jgi:hypothetical protein
MAAMADGGAEAKAAELFLDGDDLAGFITEIIGISEWRSGGGRRSKLAPFRPGGVASPSSSSSSGRSAALFLPPTSCKRGSTHREYFIIIRVWREATDTRTHTEKEKQRALLPLKTKKMKKRGTE